LRELKVFIEIKGQEILVGHIEGEDYKDAVFQYDREYLNSSDSRAISVTFPLREESFSPGETRNFFEGLLPEGFSRRAVAEWIKTDEKDYLTILVELGKECLGALKVIEGDNEYDASYEKISLEEVRQLAAEGATKSTKILLDTHLSLTGASGKVGLYYDAANKEWYLPKGSAPSTHIVKQSHVRLKGLVLNEQLCTKAAGLVGIDVPDSFIINLGRGSDSEVLFASERYDRRMSDKLLNGLRRPYRLHQEDFAQALGIASANKYEHEKSGYLKRVFELLRMRFANPIEDQTKLLRIIVFNYLIGNTDSHIKNYSLLYDERVESLRLAPAYDLVSTMIYGTSGRMSMYYGDELELSGIKRSTFGDVAREVGLAEAFVYSVFDDVAGKLESALSTAAEELEQTGFDDAIATGKTVLEVGGYRYID